MILYLKLTASQANKLNKTTCPVLMVSSDAVPILSPARAFSLTLLQRSLFCVQRLSSTGDMFPSQVHSVHIPQPNGGAGGQHPFPLPMQVVSFPALRSDRGGRLSLFQLQAPSLLDPARQQNRRMVGCLWNFKAAVSLGLICFGAKRYACTHPLHLTPMARHSTTRIKLEHNKYCSGQISMLHCARDKLFWKC